MDTQLSPLPRVLVLGHSFIRCLKKFIENHPSEIDLAFQISVLAAIRSHSVGGRTVAKTIKYYMNVVHSICPDVVVVQLGTNDLSSCPPLQVGSAIEDFVRLLQDSYGVKCVCVCQTILRRSAEVFNKNIDTLTHYLQVVLEPIPYTIYWAHRGFWKSRNNFFASDDIHLNSRGNISFIGVLEGQYLNLCGPFQGRCPITLLYPRNIRFAIPGQFL